MNRRALLGTLAVGGTVVAGCLDEDRSATSDDGSPSSDDPGIESPSVPAPSGDCGIGAAPLSSRLVEDGGNTAQCLEDLTPSLELANEREGAIAATVSVESDGEPVFETYYDFEAGECALEHGVATAAELDTVRVSVEDEPTDFTGVWPAFSCRRHAVVLTDDGIDVGYVRPLTGPADTQHDCYAGDSTSIQIYNGDTPRSGTVSVVDHCAETTATEAFDLDVSETTRISDALTSGGIYDVVIDVEDAGAERYEFDEECWGLTVSIDDDGGVEIAQVGID